MSSITILPPYPLLAADSLVCDVILTSKKYCQTRTYQQEAIALMEKPATFWCTPRTKKPEQDAKRRVNRSASFCEPSRQPHSAKPPLVKWNTFNELWLSVGYEPSKNFNLCFLAKWAYRSGSSDLHLADIVLQHHGLPINLTPVAELDRRGVYNVMGKANVNRKSDITMTVGQCVLQGDDMFATRLAPLGLDLLQSGFTYYAQVHRHYQGLKRTLIIANLTPAYLTAQRKTIPRVTQWLQETQ